MEGHHDEDSAVNDNKKMYSLLLEDNTHLKELLARDSQKLSSYKEKIKSYKSYCTTDLIEDKKKQREVEDLRIELMKEIKSLQESIDDLQSATDIDEDKSRIDAIRSILDQYSVSFDMELKVVKIEDEEYQVGINFIVNRKLCDKTIYFTINHSRNTISDFNASSFCSKDVELYYKKWFSESNNNVAGLLYRLRNKLLETMDS